MSITTESGTAAMADLRRELDAVVDAVRAGALAGAPATVLGDALRAVRSAQARLGWVALAVTREVDISGACVGDGSLTTAAWLRAQTRMSSSEASAAVTTARGLNSGALDATSAALAAGDISTDAAHQIARAARDAPRQAVAMIEPHALETARTGTAVQLATLLRRFDEALAPDRADEAALRRHERRGLSAASTLDGSVAGRFLLDEVTGSEFLTALDVAEPHTPGDTRSAAQRRADAVGAISRHFLGQPERPGGGGAHPHVIVTELRTGPARQRADHPEAPDQSAPDHAAAADREGDTEGHGGDVDEWVAPRPRPVSGLSAATARALDAALAAALADEGPRLTWVGPVAPATAARVACDANHTVVGVDPDGTITDATRKRRYFTWAQRAAIIARDGDTCPWPYCDRPIRWSHGHHLVPDHLRGPTTVANGSLPCSGHHVLLHEGGWTLVRLTDGRYLVRHDRSGRVVGPEAHRRPRGTRPPPRRRE